MSNADSVRVGPVAEETKLAAQATVEDNSEQPFLAFSVSANHSLLLPMQALVEIITPPVEQIVPMFQMPAWVMGVYNWRGSVLWVVDLSHFLGFQPWYSQVRPAARHTALVLAQTPSAEVPDVLSTTVAFVISQVDGMVACSAEAITSAESAEIAPELRPYVVGAWSGSELAGVPSPRPVLDGSVLLSVLAANEPAI